ncbi:DNA/RNA polymerase [Hesseltinella vesiculosa]|uniref:DNA-directed RNA polymerase n=1 Tax=Hesseltinella vesiculosa TaxID=101127 RepID=A0A1X2GJA0_9FUNG|nr:DNA/RNA polymerase [Hesseltinella vesiculosa]
MSLPLVRQATSANKGRWSWLPRSRSLLFNQDRSSRVLRASYATTTLAKPTDQTQEAAHKHIILPNPSHPDFKTQARVVPTGIAEQFAVLHACIQSGAMDRAQRMLNELYRNRSDEMRVFVDTQMYNTFLNGFVSGSSPPSTDDCLAWFDRMKSYGVTPDANTYAILVKGFLKNQSYRTVKILLQDMRTNTPIPIKDVLGSNFLQPEQVADFSKVVQEYQQNQQTDIQELLSELQQATETLASREPQSTPIPSTPAPSPSMLDSSRPLYKDVPSANPTKAVGVKFLQEQLSALGNTNEVMKMDPVDLQMELERQGYEVALQRLVHEREAHRERGDTLNAMHLSPLKKVLWKWHRDMIPMIEKEIEACTQITDKRDPERKMYGPFLSLLPPEKLSIIAILELLKLHNSSGISDGMKTARAVIEVGKAVEAEYNATYMKRNKTVRQQELRQLYSSGKLLNLTVRKAYQRQQEELQRQQSGSTVPTIITGDQTMDLGGGPGAAWHPVWPNTIRAKLGSVLTSMVIDAAKIPIPSHNPETGEKIIEQIPAFFHTYQYVRGKRVGIIRFSDQLTNIVAREPLRDTLHPRLMPMIVHPRAWLSYNDGGYLSAKSMCMRVKDSPEQLVYLAKASENNNIDHVLKGLDVLGSTKWRVNKQVFDVILEAWNSGKAIADIPPALSESQPLPPKPENYDSDPKAKFLWVSRVKEIQTNEKNYHSLRCDVNYKVETARAFLNLPMYFPHNMDFRGRAYPIPPTLNHLGNDLCRGLLCFDEAKPLGERGWRWLKIHMANLYGYDKHSFSEREQFTLDNLDNIIDSVKNPLTGRKWWLAAEDPWQCLAACYEVAAAVESGDPLTYGSRLPVHQDGTCNGLQHYAALGGDLAGAQAVNLAPGDRPADVYTGVADLVNKLVEQEAAKGDELAKLLVGKISRKVVKQTVMTNVYGVTFIGAKAQIESRLKERGDLPPEKIYILSGYLAKKVFASLGEMFNGARQIQDWLTDSARRIARSIPKETLQESGMIPFDSPDDEAAHAQRLANANANARKPTRGAKKKVKVFTVRNPSANQMTSVIWTTPLGLPIVQPYRRHGKKQVTTLLQTVFIEDPDASRPVNAMKQSTAFPPNFIHSLDATHMLMSASACYEQGLTFASVHDSYWTHACDVDAMNKVIRDQFIELHSQPIMSNLFDEFQERYKNYKLPVTHERDDVPAKTPVKKTKPAREPEEQDPSQLSAQEAMFGSSLLDDVDEDLADDDVDEEAEDTSPSSQRRYTYGWEDLTFAPLPAKGEFDINQVKESDYFFH